MLLLISLLLPLTTASLSLFVTGRLLKSMHLISSFALIIVTVLLLLTTQHEGAQSLVLGNWPWPFGIEFYADGLSALLMVSISLIAFAVIIFQVQLSDSLIESRHFALLQSLIGASMAISMAADLFNLYVWFELMLISVLGLMVGKAEPKNMEATLKYFILSLLGTLLMLAAVGLIYRATGHLNFNAIATLDLSPETAQQLPIYGGLLLLALLLKIGAFPLYAWLPGSYHTLPIHWLAFIGGVLTKIGVYIILRLSGQVFDFSLFYDVLGWLAVITMLSGVIGAAYHWDLRRILAFHIISQVGFLLLGVALASQAAATATFLFMIHNILVKANLFLIVGLIWLSLGHFDLRRLGGLYQAKPLLAIVFLLSAISLVGIPPSSGFWGKFLLLKEAFAQQYFVWAIAAMFTGLLTLYSMSKIWVEAFWKPLPEGTEVRPIPRILMWTVLALSVLILALGLMPEPIIQLLDSQVGGFYGGAQ